MEQSFFSFGWWVPATRQGALLLVLSPRGLLPLHTHVTPPVSLETVLLRLGFHLSVLGTEKLNFSVSVFILVACGVSAVTPRRELAPGVSLSAFPGAGCADLPLLPGGGCAGGSCEQP